MTLARLFVAALVLCSVSALAQDQQSQSFRVVGDTSVFDLSNTRAAAASEPWRIFPDSPADLRSGQNPLDQIRLGHDDFSQFKDFPDVRNFKLNNRPVTIFTLDGQLEDQPTCYAIRSYVVARDSKESDSTHPAGYSTCRPSTRYQLKTTEMRSVTQYR